jgi:hypothetical protein
MASVPLPRGAYFFFEPIVTVFFVEKPIRKVGQDRAFPRYVTYVCSYWNPARNFAWKLMMYVLLSAD